MRLAIVLGLVACAMARAIDAALVDRAKGSAPPRVAVYKSPAFVQDSTDLGLAEAALFRRSPIGFDVVRIGPKETRKLDAAGLRDVDVLAFPGGPDVATAYRDVKHAEQDLKAWLRNGGRYFGTCCATAALLTSADPVSGHVSVDGIHDTAERIRPGWLKSRARPFARQGQHRLGVHSEGRAGVFCTLQPTALTHSGAQ